jgi:hypothetical protein
VNATSFFLLFFWILSNISSNSMEVLIDFLKSSSFKKEDIPENWDDFQNLFVKINQSQGINNFY